MYNIIYNYMYFLQTSQQKNLIKISEQTNKTKLAISKD